MIIGSVIGTGIVAVLVTGLVLVNVPPFWQEVAVGAVLIIAVYIDQLRNRQDTGNNPLPSNRRNPVSVRERPHVGAAPVVA